MRTHVTYEALAAYEALAMPRPCLLYYRNEKTARIPVILEFGDKKKINLAIDSCDRESVKIRDTLTWSNFNTRAKGNHRLLLLSQTSKSYRIKGVEVCPLRG